jgi:hypothetical protein
VRMARCAMACLVKCCTLVTDHPYVWCSTVMLSALLLCAAALTPPGPQAHAELVDTGEVLLLPRHQVQPFNAWVLSRSQKPCSVIEANILNVETWPKQFDNVKSTKVTRREADMVEYEMELTVAFSPTIRGKITHVGPNTVRFNDPATKAYSVFNLVDAADGTCLIRYQIVEEKGKNSNWVGVLKSLESSSGDAGNFAAAVSSCRGFARPEKATRVKGSSAEAARVALAGQGTLIEIDRSTAYPTYTFRHRIARPFSEVSWAVRHKKAYAEKTPVVKSSDDHGTTADYTIGGFGGRVSFATTVKETSTEGTLVVDERVTGGDLKPGSGGWRWKLVAVEGGVDVELMFNLDFIAGSRVMSTAAATDPIARESFMLYVGLGFMSDIIGGQTLP